MGLANNIWWTRKARIQAEKRLLSSASHARTLLLWYSFCSAAAAIYYLKFNTQSEYADVAWVIFSVLVLCISGFINGLGYKQRASLIKDSYEALNGLYHRTKKPQANLSKLANEYEKILSICENHIDIDYQMALIFEHLRQNNLSGNANVLSDKPNKFIWTCVLIYWLRKSFMLAILYLLPPILLFIMEY